MLRLSGVSKAVANFKECKDLNDQQYLEYRVNEFFEMHGIKQQYGPPMSTDSEGKKYTILTNSGPRQEGLTNTCFWHHSCTEEIVFQFIETLGAWLNGRTYVTWRSRPEICEEVREIISREKTGFISIYCRLTAY